MLGDGSQQSCESGSENGMVMLRLLSQGPLGRTNACHMMGGLKSECDIKSFQDGQSLKIAILCSSLSFPKKPWEQFFQILSRDMSCTFPLIIK